MRLGTWRDKPQAVDAAAVKIAVTRDDFELMARG
jgi:hypothetical protein